MADDSWRLSYTQRDYSTMDAESARYIQAHNPSVNIVREGTPGRAYIRLIQALVDKLGFSVDMAAVESRLGSVQQPQNAAALAEGHAFFPSGPTPAMTDLTWTLLTGVAPAGGSAIPKGARVMRTSPSPALEFITLEDAQVPAGQRSVVVSVAEGLQVTGELLTAAYQRVDDAPVFKLGNRRVWQGSVKLYIGGEEWTYLPMSELSRGPNYPSYRVLCDLLTLDTYNWMPFTGPWAGRVIPAGNRVSVDYIRHNGLTGDTPAGKISRISGSLSSTFAATNLTAASGGSDGETAEDIRAKAPRYFVGSVCALSDEQVEGVANAVPGVLSAKVTSVDGFYITLNVMPVGGGVAATALLDAVKLAVLRATIRGAQVVVEAIQPAYVLCEVNVVLSDTRVDREAIRLKVRKAFVSALDPTKVTVGRGFALSDVAVLVEGADSRIDYTDILQLTRVPRVVTSIAGLPTMSTPSFTAAVGNATYVVTTLNATQYQVAKNGVIDPITGTIGDLFTVQGGEVSFTVGATGEVFPAAYGDTYSFSTSAYANNLRIDANEFMSLRQQSDIVVNVYLPNETPA